MTQIRPSSRARAARRASRHCDRTARSALSSCKHGTRKTAITASPMNFSTLPPCSSRIAGHVATVGVRSRSLAGERRARNPLNEAVQRTTANGRERLLTVAMQKVVESHHPLFFLLDSTHAHVSELRAGEPGWFPAVRDVRRRAAAAGAGAARGAKGRDRALRGPRRLHGARRAARSRRRAGVAVAVPRAPALGARTVRRNGREVHRRRRDGPVRRTGRRTRTIPSGRCGRRSGSGTGSARRKRTSRCGSPSTRARS